MPPHAKPYFLPDLAWDDLPRHAQIAIETIVIPAYDELVVHAPNILERSTGMSLVFLLVEEILEQFEIGPLMTFGTERGTSQERQQAMVGHLRTIAAKHKVQTHLERVRTARMQTTRPSAT